MVKKPGGGPSGTSASISKPVLQKNPAVQRQIEADSRSVKPKLSKAERLARMPHQARAATTANKGKQRGALTLSTIW